MSYDPKCYVLAENFLPSNASEDLRVRLAQHVQDSVEEWLQMEVQVLSAILDRRPL